MNAYNWKLPEPTFNVTAGADPTTNLIRPFSTGELIFCLGLYADKFKRFRSAHKDFPRGRMEGNRILFNPTVVRAWLVSKGFDTKVYDVRVAQILARPVSE